MFNRIPPLAMTNKSPLSRFVAHLFGGDEATKLIADYCLDEKGQLKMYQPEVQAALLECDGFRQLLVEKLTKRKEEDEEEEKKACKK